ncbi:MAG TPA: 2-C-methyl-D-erythritol 2,4-cyclodiphosphate synthase [Acidimicrobiales bacterium]|nr:2-C-methyl-D-erythritol 2,4-cyclodiphosphate synthase [Acidimicrobiales bacterium]
MTIRVGMGFDSHRFDPDPQRPLMIGGIRVEGNGLAGHSDGDVLAHAVADALLGAAGLGDLGTLFPATDASLSGADSMELLARVVTLVTHEGYRVANVDCVVAAEQPRLGPDRPRMEERLSLTVGAPVGVKPKRTEGLGALGRGEGIAAWAVALLERS